jgi:membrane fusion protein, multidrug efflux system
MLKLRIVTATLIAGLAAACGEAPPPAPQARPVQTVTVDAGAEGETVSLTGYVRAKDQVNLAFRLDGRMMARPVNVGDVIVPGQVVGRLDPQIQQNTLRSALASLSSTQAQLTQARLTFSRQQKLLAGGWTPHAKFDEAYQTLLSVQGQVDGAQAQVRTTQEQLGYTTLSADTSGVVTAVGAEPGEVVRGGQMVVQLARQGGRDAVFDVPEQLIRTAPRDPLVEIVLTNDPTVRAIGRVREVSPQADSVTRTFQVKVTITDPPDAMRLGSSVSGRVKLTPLPGVAIPASALTEANGRPAVWVVGPRSETVSLREVDVLRYDAATVLISRGLQTGERVVTAGAQTLRPDQKVRVLGGAS